MCHCMSALTLYVNNTGHAAFDSHVLYLLESSDVLEIVHANNHDGFRDHIRTRKGAQQIFSGSSILKLSEIRNHALRLVAMKGIRLFD